MLELRRAGAAAAALAVLATTNVIALAENDSSEPEESEDQAALSVAVEGEIIYVEDRAPEEASTATSRRVAPDEIQAAPRLSGEDLLELVPGLYMNRHGAEGKGQQLFLRGFDAVHGSDIEVTVGGIPINEPSNVHGQGYVDLGFVIPEVVIGISADKGSFRLGQGPFATAGSVDFSLGVPRSRRGSSVSYEIGTTNRHRLLAVSAPPSEADASFVAIEAMHDDGFGVNRQSERVTALGQRRVWQRGARRLDVVAGAYAARFGEPGTLPLADYEAGTMGFYDTYVDTGEGVSRRVIASVTLGDSTPSHRLRASAHAQWRFLQLSENFTGYLLYPEEGDRRLQQHESLSAGVRTTYERDLVEGVALLVGGDVLGDSLRQHEDQIRDDGTSWQWNRDLDAAQLLGDIRAGARLQSSSRLRFDAGARLDAVYIDARDELEPERSGRHGMVAVSPRISSAVKVSPGLQLFLSYGRGLRPPEARSITTSDLPNEDVDLSLYTGGEPRITTSDAAEIGARLLSGQVDLGGAVFATWIDNEMLFDHVSGTNVELNSTRRLGVEAFVDYGARSWLGVRADVTAVDARFVESGNPVPSAPRFLARIELSLRSGRGVTGEALLTYAGARPLAHGATAGATTLLEIGGRYRWRKLEANLCIDNALDAHWREGEYHFASWFDRSRPASQIPRIHFAAGRPLGVRLALTSWF